MIYIGLSIVLLGILITNKLTYILNDAVDRAKESSNEKDTEYIIRGVELAYTLSLYENVGNNSTLQQVKSNFSLGGATWNNDYVIETNGFNCDVKVENNNLKVTCLNKETTTSMILFDYS